jgi:hypothetical protein
MEIEMPLSEVIENIQRGTWELVEDRRKHRADLKAKALEFCAIADASEGAEIMDKLMDNFSSAEGDASMLEDGRDWLQGLADRQDDIDNPPLCPQCSGSGEGQHENTRCMSCKGKGTISRREE